MIQPSTTLALISTTLLNSYKVLALLRELPFHQPIYEDVMRETVYLAYLPWAARVPDHVFARGWQQLVEQDANKERSWWLPGALQALAGEFITQHHGQLYVKLEKFGAWQQSVLSRISGVPVQAAAHAWLDEGAYRQTDSTTFSAPDANNWAKRHSPILSPYDPQVEDYLNREGIHETHLHFNGSTHAEECWLRALYRPERETVDLASKWNDNSLPGRKLRELGRAINPEFSPTELRRQLCAARHLREWLIAAATGALSEDLVLPFDYAALVDSSAPTFAPTPDEPGLALSDETCVEDERRWISLLLGCLMDKPSMLIERMLHLYLLIQNLYYRLLVQSEEQYGFDQFQKLTWTELREPVEKDYLNRFRNMHGPQPCHSRIDCLEGRFAPKDSPEKNERLFRQIIGGYWEYLEEGARQAERPARPPRGLSELLSAMDDKVRDGTLTDRCHLKLALVAHFIKQEEEKYDHPYRFYSLRQKLDRQAHALIGTLDRYPRLRRWVRGIDAAANELHAPPEVFASCYRLCQGAGLSRRSFHAGEDFPHLLSGLRAMSDAMELLDLRDGDRIGHGTAMGVDPQLWMRRMPGTLMVPKGDWLLDLLATWRLLQRLGVTAPAIRVEIELTELASELFGAAQLFFCKNFQAIPSGWKSQSLRLR